MKTKKSRRIISLVLALTMVFTFMAMSASAAMTEVQPRGTCPNCTHGYVTTTTNIDGNYYDYPYYLTTCTAAGFQHAHYYNIRYVITATCPVCHYVETTRYTDTNSSHYYCAYGG